MKAVIVSGIRTPLGSFLGTLSSLTAPQLGYYAIKGALEKAKINPNDIDQVIMGEVLQGGVGQAPARQAALLAGVPKNVPCTTVNKVCGSGLKAIMMAEDAIKLGASKIVVAGGMESMSNAPFSLPNARTGYRMGNQVAIDLMIHDGLFDPYGQAHMGNFGDKCAKEFAFSREDQDVYAHESYQRAISAQERGFFKDEIVPITIEQKGVSKLVAIDEELSRYQKDKVAQLRPSFNKDGTITAANASKISDGAAVVIVSEEQEAKQKKFPIQARLIASSTYAHDPEWFTTAPIFAIKEALKNASLKIEDIDLFEINEAFSVVAMTAIKELKINRNQVNIFGGAVALGHPIGCSGARLMVTMLNALAKENKRLGLVSLCIGGGEAVAMIIERV